MNYFVSQPVGLGFTSGSGFLPVGLDFATWVWIWKPHAPDSLLYHVIYTQPWHKINYISFAEETFSRLDIYERKIGEFCEKSGRCGLYDLKPGQMAIVFSGRLDRWIRGLVKTINGWVWHRLTLWALWTWYFTSPQDEHIFVNLIILQESYWKVRENLEKVSGQRTVFFLQKDGKWGNFIKNANYHEIKKYCDFHLKNITIIILCSR